MMKRYGLTFETLLRPRLLQEGTLVRASKSYSTCDWHSEQNMLTQGLGRGNWVRDGGTDERIEWSEESSC